MSVPEPSTSIVVVVRVVTRGSLLEVRSCADDTEKYSGAGSVGRVKIFISWSGPREQAVAEALQAALPDLCVADVEVFVSSQSISKGANGVAVIEANLDSSAFGVVLVSKANQTAPWLNYEGGWLASTLDRPVATVCLDLLPSDITGPLAPRQATRFEDAEDMAKLLRQIVEAANPAMKDRAFKTLLGAVWPSIKSSWIPAAAKAPPAPARDERDMLAELVDRVRRIDERGQNASPRSVGRLDDKHQSWEMFDRSLSRGRIQSSPFERAVRKAVLGAADGEAQVFLVRETAKDRQIVVGVTDQAPADVRNRINDAILALGGFTEGITSIQFLTIDSEDDDPRQTLTDEPRAD